ncbi:putative transcription factor Ovo-like 1 [Megalops cyprinoides]|uniref:putative transcription factor Ovo-like 1 n=1 Tax=Megalops cyprinoides TaxID=118141 RepID=UPI001864383E|nr:putative transcription factor Ovo-like 1 [Megalops cyprinoides]
MPRAFLVKKANISPGRRNWSQLPDHERGEIYIPVSLPFPLCVEESEASLAESALCLSTHEHGMHTQSRAQDTPVHAAELPSCTAQGQQSAAPAEWARVQGGAYVRSKIKVTTGDPPIDEPPSVPSLQSASAVPGVSPGVPPAAFVCQVCEKGFQYQRMLKRHLKCHNESKRHLCNYCGKGFNDTFDLKRHVRTHTGVRPYKCSLCDKAFTQRCSLESHMKKIHGVTQQYAYKERRTKLYVCEDCGLTAQTQDSLLRHLQAQHPHSAMLRAKAGRKAGASGAKDGRPSQEAGSSPNSPRSPDSDATTGSA